MAVDVKDWYYRLRQVICRGEFAEPLRGAAQANRLGQWTQLLTRAVVETCQDCGWTASAREHEAGVLPVPRQKYLGLDVIAFDSELPEATPRWRLPVAVFELENRDNQDIIAYSLWKVMVVRCGLRGVFCYRKQPEQVPQLVASLGQMVVDSQAQTAVTGAIVKKWTILENMDNTSGYTMSMEVLLGGLPQPTALTVDVALPFGENPSQLNQRISDAIVAQATRFGFSLSRTSVIIPSFTKGQ